MKKSATRYHLSLSILVPFILGGLAGLATIASYFFTGPMATTAVSDSIRPYIIAGSSGLCTFIASGWLVLVILRPVRTFINRATNLRIISHSEDPNPAAPPRHDDLQTMHTVFTQVTQVLDKINSQEHFPDMVGQSIALRAVFSQILKVAPTSTSVLITGESGTGKELVARNIHRHSQRKDAAFVAVNCAAIPAGLLESELFGHVRGAFTGATSDRIGKFELAHGGTLFLDEIGDMDIEIQPKILRALETGTFERVGGTRSIHSDVRIIAASHQNLSDKIKDGTFREDLFHRLHVFPVNLPPLRNRREDIPLLAERFLKEFGPDKTFSAEAMQLLISREWSGNVRELRNAIERCAVLADGSTILPVHLEGLQSAHVADSPSTVVINKPLEDALRELEISILVRALAQSGGVQKKAAELLSISERSMWHRIKKYNIDPKKCR